MPYHKLRQTVALLLFAASLGLSTSHAQQYTISGYIKDGESGEDLIGAVVRVETINAGSVTNTYGYYSISLPQGTHELKVFYIGFVPEVRQVSLSQDTVINFSLTPEPAELDVVEINANTNRQDLDRTQMSKVDLQMTQVKELPVLFGEVDILKTLQLLPGVQSGNEGSTGFYVRGGGPDQNLIVLDEAVVYNASHLFGFFSVFNSDAIKNVELYKGGYPAKYGGRLSSVVEINLKEGNKKEFHGAGGIGLIASRLTLEGPIKKDKASFIISGRRTYLDIFTRLINESNEGKAGTNPIPDYYFYDLNTKLNFELNGKNRLFLSGYFGRDVFGFNRETFNFGFNWGNATTTARWNHIFSPKLFLNTTATFTDYNYSIENSFDIFNFKLGSHIRDYTLKADFDLALNPKHYIKFGASGIYHIFGLGSLQFEGSDDALDLNYDNEDDATELGIYISDDWAISEKWKLNLGLRLSNFLNDSATYVGLEPRLAALYKVNKDISLKASYTDMNQYVHLVSNSGSTLPTDMWYPSTAVVQPQRARQVAGGATVLVLNDKFAITNELFYKWMRNQIDFRDAAQLYLNDNLDQEFVFGKGWSYGNELFIEKREGKLTGWIGYTLSWSHRQFEKINSGVPFPPKYDRRHDISVVASYTISKRLTASATWVYGTGNAVSMPVAWSYYNDVVGSDPFILPIYTDRNQVRMAPYHRMDLAIVWKFFPKWGSSDLTFSVYNVYNRLNPFILYIEQDFPDEDDLLPVPQGARARQVSLFPIIPSITYNFKF